MKFHLPLLFLLCVGLYHVNADRVREWGATRNFPLISTQQIFVEEPNSKSHTRVLKFPKNWFSTSKYIIRGVRQSDYAPVSSTATIVKGGLGENQFHLELKSGPGQSINSIVEFFGEPIQHSHKSHVAEHNCKHCVDTESVREWGTFENYTLIATEKIYAKEQKKHSTHKVIKLPKGWFASPKFIIRGIRQFDYGSTPTTSAFVQGGLNKTFVEFRISSEPGHSIRSIVDFYGEPIPKKQLPNSEPDTDTDTLLSDPFHVMNNMGPYV